MNIDARRQRIFDEIVAERDRQLKTWGDQTHNAPMWVTILTEELGEAAQAALELRRDTENYEGFRDELVHVAAVAVAALEDADRRFSKQTSARRN